MPLSIGQHEQVSPEVTDQALCEAFRSFHAEVARLDFVKETVNLAQASRHRLKDGRISLQGSGRAFRIGASTDAAFLPPGGAE